MSDTYVYLYEIVDADAANNLAQLKATFSNPGRSITAMGYLDHRAFLDGGGNPIGPAAHQAIGNNGLLGTGTTGSGPAGPASINATGANPNSGGNQASFSWNPQIPPGGYSSIVFVTSNFAPSLQPCSIRDNNGGISVGSIPGVGVPEPSSSALLLCGVGCPLAGGRRGRGPARD